MTGRQWGGRRAQRIRQQFKPLIEACEVVCHFCGRLIIPGQRWDIDHIEAHANGGGERNYMERFTTQTFKASKASSQAYRLASLPDPKTASKRSTTSCMSPEAQPNYAKCHWYPYPHTQTQQLKPPEQPHHPARNQQATYPPDSDN